MHRQQTEEEEEKNKHRAFNNSFVFDDAQSMFVVTDAFCDSN